MNDEELIALYYRDGLDAATLRRLEALVADDAELAARYAALRADLDAVARIAPAPVPAAVKQNWHDALSAEIGTAAGGGGEPTVSRAAMGWPLALAATLVVGVLVALGAGMQMGEPQLVPAAPEVAVVDQRRPIAERGFAQHLRSGRTRLAALDDSEPVERDALIRSLLAENRLQQRVAAGADAADLLRLLRAFELTLLEIDANPADEAHRRALRARLEFEFQTTLHHLDRQPAQAGSARALTPL